MKRMRVAILGAGPTAAYVKEACREENIEYQIFAQRVVTEVAGAFWFRNLPLSLQVKDLKPKKIVVSFKGTEQGYLEKQWDTSFLKNGAISSFPKENLIYYGYDAANILTQLWDGEHVREMFLHAITIEEMCKQYSFVFITFPLPKWVESRQDFIVRRSVSKHTVVNDGNWVEYDGINGTGVVRQSKLFGNKCIELLDPALGDHMFMDLHPWIAPLTKGEIPTKNLIPIGRYATFQRQLLVEDSYTAIKKLFREKSYG